MRDSPTTIAADVRCALLDATLDAPGQVLRARFRFDSWQAVFVGHFPGRPMLPGVFLLQLAPCALCAATGNEHRVRRVTRAKFARPILPGDTIDLEASIERQDDEMALRARFTVEGALAGSAIMGLFLPHSSGAT